MQADTALQERDARTGHFLPGNSIGFGHKNPQGARVALLKQAILDAVTADDVRQVMDALKKEALAGNVFAAAHWLDRVIGKTIPATPEQQSDVIAILRDEWRAWAKSPAQAVAEDAEFRAVDG